MVALHDNEPTSSIKKLRLALSIIVVSGIIYPHFYQSSIDFLWDNLRRWSVYRWSTFETLWTVFCYAAIEVPITVAFMKHPEWRLTNQRNNHDQKSGPTKPKGMRRPSRRGYEALLYVAPLLLLDLTMIKKFADVSLEDMLLTGNYDFPTSYHGGHKATFLVPSLHNFTLSSPLQTERALPATAPSSRRLLLELIASFFIYDSLFFAFHLAMHILPVLRTWHRPHHSHADIHPQVTNQLHIFERLGLVLLANFSLNIIGSHVLTRTAFVPLFVWLLVEIHSGMDLPWAYDKILPSRWGGGARKHAAHHRDGSGGYEPFFEWWDTIWNAAAR